MAQRRREGYTGTDGALALERARERDYRTAAMRYGAREARPVPGKARPAQAKPRARAGIVLFVVLLFAGGFFLLFRQVQIETGILELHSMRTELTDAQQRGDNLRLQLSLKMDIDNVQKAAKDTMQMAYPDLDETMPVVLPPIKTVSTLDKANVEVPAEEEPSSLALWLKSIQERFSD